MKRKSVLSCLMAAVMLSLLLLCSGCGAQPSASGEAQTAESASQPVEAAAEPTAEPVEIPIDFDEWQSINSDVYAWITVPGTNIDYPVLQSGEDEPNDYYLEYCIDHTKGRPGAIYSEKDYNPKTFNDYVTILYGHDMWSNDTYFHQLHLLEDKSFFDENRTVTVYTPDEILNYTIFAVFNYDDRHLMMSNYGFTMASDKENFLNEVFDIRDMTANIDQSMKDQAMEEESRILILSTCNQISEDQRYLTLAVLD